MNFKLPKSFKKIFIIYDKKGNGENFSPHYLEKLFYFDTEKKEHSRTQATDEASTRLFFCREKVQQTARL